ncbi:MAG: hypothetical protein ACTSUN_10235 [Promethearchaeota archaeon]
MADMEIISQIVLIALGMVILGHILNKILGLKRETTAELREKSLNLQERMKTAQVLQDRRMMLELQFEMKELMATMLKKQILPLSIRCIIFFGIFTVIGVVYGQYSYWFWTYFIASLCFSLISFGLNRLYRKITGKEDKTKSLLNGIMGSMTQEFNPSENIVSHSGSISSPIQQAQKETLAWKSKINAFQENNQEKEKSRSLVNWKEKLQK